MEHILNDRIIFGKPLIALNVIVDTIYEIKRM